MAYIQVWDIFLNTVLVATTFSLLYIFLWYNVVLIASLLVLAIVIAHCIINIFRDSLPGLFITDVKDKAVLITGCDTGFGNMLAKQLDAKGVQVFAGCLFADGPEALKLKESCSENLHILQIDVTRDDHVKSAVKYVVNNLGDRKLWAIVNNAGIGIGAELEFTTIYSAQKTLDVNTIGVMRVTNSFLPLLRQSKGRVVIVASTAGRLPGVYMGTYCMSKFATVAYAQVLRMEILRWGISVHTIEPWVFKTNISKRENALPNIRREWDLTSESIRNEYGGDRYLEQFEKILDLYEAICYPESKVHYVTDCMLDAAIGKYPRLKYAPGFIGRILFYVYTVTSKSLNDLLTAFIVLPKIGGPQEKEDSQKFVFNGKS